MSKDDPFCDICGLDKIVCDRASNKIGICHHYNSADLFGMFSKPIEEQCNEWCHNPFSKKRTIRECARTRIPIDVIDTQALEGALQQCEREHKQLIAIIKKLAEQQAYQDDWWKEALRCAIGTRAYEKESI